MGISLDEQPEKSKRKRDGGKPSPALVAPETIAFGSPSLVVDKATKDTDSVSTSAIVQEKSDNARPTSCFTPSAKASVPDKAASFADNNESPPNTQSPSTCGHQNAAASIEEALRKTTKSETKSPSKTDDAQSSRISRKADSKTSDSLAIQNASVMNRKSRWYSSLTAFRYVSTLSKDDDVRIRDSDRATGLFLLIATAVTAMSLLLPQLASHRLAFVLASDTLLGAMLLLYVANRFGILNTLNARQALLCWQLVMGAAFLGIFLTINLAVAVAFIVSSVVSH